MGFLLSIVFCILAISIAYTCIGRVVIRCAHLKNYYPFLVFTLVIWLANIFHRAVIWLPKSYGKVSFDGHGHERVARRVAESLSNGSLSLLDIGVFSNEGYRNFLGVFYWLTDASIIATYVIHGIIAYIALLFILESISIVTERKLPLWALVVVMLLPSAIIFTPWNMKEAPALFGISLILRFVVICDFYGKEHSAALLTGIGAFVLLLLRPQVALAWLLAAGLGIGFGRHRNKNILLMLASIILSYFIVVLVGEQLAPGLLGKIQEEGLINAIDKMTDHGESYGGSVIYRHTTPVPVISGLVFSMFEPNPTYWGSPTFAIVGLEAWVVSVFGIWNWINTRNRLKIILSPTGLTCLLVVLGLAFYFGYMYNMGLMVRQRLQIMPALIMLAVIPLRKHETSTTIPRINAPKPC